MCVSQLQSHAQTLYTHNVIAIALHTRGGQHPCHPPGTGVPPGPMLVGEDVDDLLDQLCGGDVVAVLGRPDEVVAHLLLVALLRRVLSAVRLGGGGVTGRREGGAEGKGTMLLLLTTNLCYFGV